MTTESLDELRAAGEKVAEGRFRVDTKRALERLRHNRLADPSHWVLDILRTAQASGATRVDMRTDADDVELHFDGKPIPAAAMKDLLNQALGSDSGSEPRVRLFALGIAGALGVGLKSLVVKSGGTSATFDATGEVTVEKTKGEGTHVVARKKLSLKVAAALIKGSPEAAALHTRVYYFVPALYLNGKREASLTLPGPVEERGGLSISVEVATMPVSSLLNVEMLGVRVTNRILHLPGLQLDGVVSCADFQRNASGDDIVENDPSWLEAVKRLEQKSLAVLKSRVAIPDAWLRAHIERALQNDKLDPQARELMESCPLIPGPSGELVSIAALKEDVEAGRPVRFATREYPKDTCPKNTVLLTSHTRETWAPLLPGKKREDVAPLVARKMRAALNKATWEAQPQLRAVLDKKNNLAVATIDTPKLKGEVGIATGGAGAFVRLLAQGRFLQSGEVTPLAPLRLQAVVDYLGNITDKTWADLPTPKIWSLVVDEIEAAYERAVVHALETRDEPLAALKHARDLLSRAALKGRALKDLPPALQDAPLFELLGGGLMSLRDLKAETQWRYVSRPFDDGLLSNKRVLQLSHGDFELLAPHAEGRWKDVTDQLEREALIRTRLRAGKREPRVDGKLVAISFENGPIHGEVALAANDNQLNVDLYRDGFLLERTRVAAQYGTAWAAVDNPALAPNEGWTAALRDGAFHDGIAAVRAVERQLAREVLKTWPSFSRMHASARHYLLSFIQKEIRGADFSALDEFAKPVVETPFIETPWGPTSLMKLRDDASACGHIWLVAPGRDASALKGQAVIVGGSDLENLVKQAIDWSPEDGSDELRKAYARQSFRAQALYDKKAKPDAPLRVEVEHGGLRCVAWLDDALSHTAAVDLLNESRLFGHEEVDAGLPMKMTAEYDPSIDPATSVTPETREALAVAVGLAQARMLEQALDDPNARGSRRAVMFALKTRLDEKVLEGLSARLKNAPVFECQDGVSRAAAVFDRLQKVSFITRRFDEEVRASGPVIVATGEDVAIGLGRFAKREDVTQNAERELETRRFRAQLPKIEEVKVSSETLVARRVRGNGIEGEVAIALDADGAVEVLMDHRPICTVPAALPWPFAAAVNTQSLTPNAFGVERDAAYDALLRQLQDLCEGLVEDFAKQWEALPPTQKTLEAALRACAWVHKRHKNQKAPNPLAELPLLTATDGSLLSVRNLLEQKEVLYADRVGALLEADKHVWRASARIRDMLGPFKLKLTDATQLLEKADALRARPRAQTLDVPLASKWRERIVGEEVEGEVVLDTAPTAELCVDLFRQRTLLEHYTGKHAAGAMARLNCDALTPNAAWTKANRNNAFKAVMAAVERALEKLVARRVLDEQHDERWRAWCVAAVKWDASPDGPLRQALPLLEVFTSLEGKPISIGALFADFHRTRRVAVATDGLDPGGALVLLTSPETLALLEALHLTVKDVSQELKRKGELEADRRSRRLAELRWSGDALCTHEVHGDGMLGELAFPSGTLDGYITIAKQGVRIAILPKELAPCVAGVLDVEALEVDETWTQHKLTQELRERIAHEVDALLLKLARTVPDLSGDARTHARDVVLQWLKHSGVQAPVHLERLLGGPLALSTAPVFETVDGEWVSVVALADEVRRRGRLAVFKRSLFTPDTLGALALKAKALEDGWLGVLDEVLGKGSVERVTDAGKWREELREEDPPKGSAELRGLERLRRDVRLLRVGALGALAPEDLEDVRFKALGGDGAPVQYDEKRRLALLDSDHPQVKKALAESSTRRERLYVLLAAMYGAINRALERITDQHEEELAGALAAHLAANPQLLEPKEEPTGSLR